MVDVVNKDDARIHRSQRRRHRGRQRHDQRPRHRGLGRGRGQRRGLRRQSRSPARSSSLVMNQGGGSPGDLRVHRRRRRARDHAALRRRRDHHRDRHRRDRSRSSRAASRSAAQRGSASPPSVLVRDGRTKAWIGRDADIEAEGRDRAHDHGDPVRGPAADLRRRRGRRRRRHRGLSRRRTSSGTTRTPTSTAARRSTATTRARPRRRASRSPRATPPRSSRSPARVSVGGTASVGAGVDVEAITKGTKAWIGPDVTANVRGDITVDAESSESITSISVGGGFGGTAAVNVNAAVSVLNITTQAFVEHGLSSGDGAVLTADGNVRIAANEKLDLDLVAGNISGSGTAAVGAAASVPVITKTTTAYIGDHARVTGKGGGGGLSVKTGCAQPDADRHPLRRCERGLRQHDRPRLQPRLRGRRAGHVRQRRRDVDRRAHRQRRRHERRVRPPVRCVLRDLRRRDAHQAERHSRRRGEGARAGQRSGPPHRRDAGSERPEGRVAAVRPGPAGRRGRRHADAPVLARARGERRGHLQLRRRRRRSANLEDGETYYVVAAGANTLKLSKEKGGPAIVFSSVGTGRSHTIVESGSLPAADPSSFGPRTIDNPSLPTPFRGVAVTATNSDDIAGVGIAAGFVGLRVRQPLRRRQRDDGEHRGVHRRIRPRQLHARRDHVHQPRRERRPVGSRRRRQQLLRARRRRLPRGLRRCRRRRRGGSPHPRPEHRRLHRRLGAS